MSGLDHAVKFPAGFTIRPPRFEDAPAVAEIAALSETHDAGEPDADLQDVLNDWRRPSFDIEMDAILVLDEAGAPVAEAELSVADGRAEVAILPSVRGRGLGPALLSWTESRAREAGCSRIGQTRPDSPSAGAELLLANGYEALWKSWVLEIVLEEEPVPAEIPDGIDIRTFEDPDARNVHELIQTAFSEWVDHIYTFEDWSALTLESETFDPSLMLLATAGEKIVGAAYCLGHAPIGYVQALAVERSHRNRGIAKALLQRAFLTFWLAGKPKVELSTDSRTGALGLYEHVGMHVARTYTRYSKDL